MHFVSQKNAASLNPEEALDTTRKGNFGFYKPPHKEWIASRKKMRKGLGLPRLLFFGEFFSSEVDY